MGLTICSLASGSSGNATYISTGRTSILVDCGPSARDVVHRLAQIGVHPSQIDGILITHAHMDHHRSTGTLSLRYSIPVYVDPSTAAALHTKGQWTSWRRLRETFPIPERIGDIEVQALDTSHGSPERDGRTVAYVLRCHDGRVGVVTDLGVTSEDMIEHLSSVDALVLEANYDEDVIHRKLADPSFAEDWHYLAWVLGDRGHLSNRQCAEMLAAILTERDCHVFLGHVSENHFDPRQDNNDYRRSVETIRGLLQRERLPVPHLHRTYRIGREPSRPSDRIEI